LHVFRALLVAQDRLENEEDEQMRPIATAATWNVGNALISAAIMTVRYPQTPGFHKLFNLTVTDSTKFISPQGSIVITAKNSILFHFNDFCFQGMLMGCVEEQEVLQRKPMNEHLNDTQYITYYYIFTTIVSF
jgi:hypothetical protein